MKITVWLVTWERGTYIAATETLILALVLLVGPGTALRLVLGLPILAHLGYTALTSLPLGMIPGRPAGSKRQRRNRDLRLHVSAFLQEVRRVEEYVHRAKVAGRPGGEVEDNLQAAERRMMALATNVVKVTGRSSATSEAEQDRAGPRTIRMFAPIVREVVHHRPSLPSPR